MVLKPTGSVGVWGKWAEEFIKATFSRDGTWKHNPLSVLIHFSDTQKTHPPWCYILAGSGIEWQEWPQISPTSSGCLYSLTIDFQWDKKPQSRLYCQVINITTPVMYIVTPNPGPIIPNRMTFEIAHPMCQLSPKKRPSRFFWGMTSNQVDRDNVIVHDSTAQHPEKL